MAACSSAADLQARLAFRALFPAAAARSSGCEISGGEAAPQGAGGGPRGEVVKAGAQVVVGEDFLSDSGMQDKVQLLQGQRGLVIKINESGHASIDFEDHEKLQWVSRRNLHKLEVEGPLQPAEQEVEEATSSLRRGILEELNDAMESGFQRRLGRLEQKLAAASAARAAAATATCASTEQQQQQWGEDNRREVEEEEEGGTFKGGRGGSSGGGRATARTVQQCSALSSASSLSKVLAKALQTRPLAKQYGPSELQQDRYEPQVDMTRVDVVSETTTLRSTLESLEENIGRRIRQISSLRNQLMTCEGMCRNVDSDVKDVQHRERALLEDPSLVQKAHAEKLSRRRTRVKELVTNVERSSEKAKQYKSLFEQQQRYLLQSESVCRVQQGPTPLLARHPSGDIVLVPQPLPLGDETLESWDVGTAVADPYTVDSWPFDPNVLANRTFQQERDPNMPPFQEETRRDLENEERRLPNFIPGLHLPTGGVSDDDDDEYEEGYGRRTGTSRSL